MGMRRVFILAVAALAVAGIGSCSKKSTGGLEVKGGVAARIADTKISEREMQRRFDELSEKQKKLFKGREGKADFTDKLIEQKLLAREALAEGLDKSEEVRDRIDELKENILVAEYFKKKIEGKSAVTEQEVEEYFTSHKEEFTNPAVLRAQYIFSTDSLKAARWLKQIRAGADFGRLAKAESEDKTTAPANGDLGYFNPGGYIRTIGTSEVFAKAVENLAVGQVSPVIHFEKGYAVVKMNEKTPPTQKELSAVAEMIRSKLTQTRVQEVYTKEVERLKSKYETKNYIRETLTETTRTPEELWEMAQLEDDAEKRIQYYRDIVTLYPTHKNAPQALFMIGFVYAEDLRDYRNAERTFDELQKKYPESDMSASAKWMNENMRSPRPRFESVEKMQKAMEDEKAAKERRGD